MACAIQRRAEFIGVPSITFGMILGASQFEADGFHCHGNLSMFGEHYARTRVLRFDWSQAPVVRDVAEKVRGGNDGMPLPPRNLCRRSLLEQDPGFGEQAELIRL